MEKFRLFILDNRFVFIGEGEPFECPLVGRSIRIKQAYNVRVWGTTNKGLGWLAIDGIQPETKLDYCGTIDVAVARICFSNPITEKSKKSFYGE